MGLIHRLVEQQKQEMAEGGAYGGSISMRGLPVMLAYDVGIPVGAYYLARLAGAGTFLALLVATLAAGARLLWTVWRQREVDGFALFMLIVFGGGLVASFWTGDERFLLLKNAVATGFAGVVFALSAAARRPLSYAIAKRMSLGDEQAHRDMIVGWQESRSLRKGFYIMTVVWGTGLVAEAVLRVWVIYQVGVDTAVALTAGIQVGTFALLGAWNVWFVLASRRLAVQRGTVRSGERLQPDPVA
jgi:intracellular septation protein A